jgi:hypothetical protein
LDQDLLRSRFVPCAVQRWHLLPIPNWVTRVLKQLPSFHYLNIVFYTRFMGRLQIIVSDGTSVVCCMWVNIMKVL